MTDTEISSTSTETNPIPNPTPSTNANAHRTQVSTPPASAPAKVNPDAPKVLTFDEAMKTLPRSEMPSIYAQMVAERSGTPIYDEMAARFDLGNGTTNGTENP